jgi:hypothetical protein
MNYVIVILTLFIVLALIFVPLNFKLFPVREISGSHGSDYERDT